MTDKELQEIIEKSREFLPDPKQHAKPGKRKIFRVPHFPPPKMVSKDDISPNKRTPYNEVEFELKQTGFNTYEWEYKRYIEE